MTEPILDIDALVKCIIAGKKQKFLFFWGHQNNHHSRIGKACLSQWYPAQFEHDGNIYSSAEHYMMAEKARLFGDETSRQAIIKSISPGAAKALGRQIQRFDETTWQAHRFEIVVQANELKFGQNEALNEFLKSTGDKVLVEASPVDRIWGIGMAENEPNFDDPRLWKGLNLLGFALMQTRYRLNQN